MDAINALDLYFKVINKPADRETIVRALQDNHRVSIAKLAEAVRGFGVPLQAVRPPISSLKDGAFPVIIHMFDEKEQNGGYCLLLDYNDSIIQVVNAATATIAIYSADEFRRRWSGYALAPEDSTLSSVRIASVTVLSVAGYLLCRYRRLGRWKQHANEYRAR